MALGVQGRVSDAHLRGEAACAKLQEKLDISGAALQTAASQHKELDKQKKAADRKLVHQTWLGGCFSLRHLGCLVCA